MKKNFITASAALIFSITSYSEVITIYAPESMKWLEKEFKEDFKKKTGDEIRFVGMKGILSRAKLERGNPKSDILLGLTQISGEQAKSENLITPFKPSNSSLISRAEFIMDREWYMTPFDYGAMAINYNRKTLPNPPADFTELSRLDRKLIMEDPRSSTGQEILLWSVALYGDNWKEFWKNLKPAILTVTSDWDDAFAKFSADEAPMMMGYATSNAYFYWEKEEAKYDSFIPAEGGYIYLEGAALTNRKEIKEGAKKFIEYLLTPEAQEKIVKNNYMLPVTDIEIGKEFQYIPVPEKIVSLDPAQAVKNLDKWKNELVEILSK